MSVGKSRDWESCKLGIPVTILAKHSDFTDIFLEELVNVFSKQTRANEHVIELEPDKHPFYGPIYS